MAGRIVSAFVIALIVAGGSADAAEPEAKEHEGVWKPFEAVIGGAPLPKAALQVITLKIHGKTYEVAIEGNENTDRGTFTLDMSTSPKRMTIKSTEGPNRGKIFLAIYEIKDTATMRICYDLSGKEFPKEFKAAKGTPHYLVGYRRQKEKPAEKTAPPQ